LLACSSETFHIDLTKCVHFSGARPCVART
jgi:hypothetical protein